MDVDERHGIPHLAPAAEDRDVRGAVDEGDPPGAGSPRRAIGAEGQRADAVGVALGSEGRGLGGPGVVAGQRSCADPPHRGGRRKAVPRHADALAPRGVRGVGRHEAVALCGERRRGRHDLVRPGLRGVCRERHLVGPRARGAFVVGGDEEVLMADDGPVLPALSGVGRAKTGRQVEHRVGLGRQGEHCQRLGRRRGVEGRRAPVLRRPRDRSVARERELQALWHARVIELGDLRQQRLDNLLDDELGVGVDPVRGEAAGLGHRWPAEGRHTPLEPLDRRLEGRHGGGDEPLIRAVVCRCAPGLLARQADELDRLPGVVVDDVLDGADPDLGVHAVDEQRRSGPGALDDELDVHGSRRGRCAHRDDVGHRRRGAVGEETDGGVGVDRVEVDDDEGRLVPSPAQQQPAAALGRGEVDVLHLLERGATDPDGEWPARDPEGGRARPPHVDVVVAFGGALLEFV
ncbi:MAG: hypothetical protein BWY91_01809 [bacterium ADurb.BinA028]|nr:MAG: hypothetical protein BWY91_01809 [bacterium ADurb.BinA028]